MGDFNARLLRNDGLSRENFGKHFLTTEKDITEINRDVWENRERFVEFVQENELVAMNTMFNKRRKNRCTYKNKNSGHKGGKPWNTTNYGQIDYILIEKRWKNAIFEAWTTPYAHITSDHFPLIGRLRIKLAKKEKSNRECREKQIKIDHWKTMQEAPEKITNMNE